MNDASGVRDDLRRRPRQLGRGDEGAEAAAVAAGGDGGQRLAAGGVDLSIDQSKFRNQFALDVPEAEAALMTPPPKQMSPW